MSQFSSWFNHCYIKWTKSQPGEDDFVAFCDLLGYPPGKVLGWLKDEAIPDGPEVLSLVGLLGDGVCDVLNLPKPDPELITIFCSFTLLNGQDRSRVAMAIFEADKRLIENNFSPKSFEAKEIFTQTFEKYGLHEPLSSNNQSEKKSKL